MSQKLNTDVHYYWYGRDGKPLVDTPVGSKKWHEQVGEVEKLLTNKKYKVVKQEDVGDYWVSTVWLGIDHSFIPTDEPNPRPLIFETMVFNKKKSGYLDLDMDRYATEEEAIKGHERMVKKWKKKLNEPQPKQTVKDTAKISTQE